MTVLHGFFGLPSDWHAVFPAEEFGEIEAIAWGRPLKDGPRGRSLPALGERLNRDAKGDSILIGYSMGGRIAMHMLLAAGHERWQRAVIVSSSPGISDSGERAARTASDRAWAQKFRSDPWQELHAAWEAQPIFHGEPSMQRRETDFVREHLACALERASVGLQADLRQPLSELRIPVLWVAGSRDRKYAALAEECAALNPLFEVRILEDAGHRAPWSGTDQLRKVVRQWTP